MFHTHIPHPLVLEAVPLNTSWPNRSATACGGGSNQTHLYSFNQNHRAVALLRVCGSRQLRVCVSGTCVFGCSAPQSCCKPEITLQIRRDGAWAAHNLMITSIDRSTPITQFNESAHSSTQQQVCCVRMNLTAMHSVGMREDAYDVLLYFVRAIIRLLFVRVHQTGARFTSYLGQQLWITCKKKHTKQITTHELDRPTTQSLRNLRLFFYAGDRWIG